MSDLKIARGYEEDFDQDWFLKTYYGTVAGSRDEGDLLPFFLDSFHDIFASGTIQGERLLDIGTGPTVHSVISASRHVSDIHLSDLVERNRDILQKWRDGEPNVEAIFEYLIGKENDSSTLEARVTEVRAKVTNIYTLDLRNPQPMGDLDRKYDVITCSLALESAATNTAEYATLVTKVADMLNPGGYFVLVGVLNQHWYRVGDFRFDNLFISGDEVKRSVTDAGFEIKIWRDSKNENYNPRESSECSDYGGLFALAAQKKECA